MINDLPLFQFVLVSQALGCDQVFVVQLPIRRRLRGSHSLVCLKIVKAVIVSQQEA